MMADLFSLYSCCGQSATKFSNCLYRACNCSNVIVYRRHPVSSMIPRCSTGMEITRLIPYFILILDCGPGFPGPGLLVVILEKVNIGTGGGHFLYLFRYVCKGFRKGTKREIVVGPNAVVKLDDCGNSAERVNLKGTAEPTELRVIVEFEGRAIYASGYREKPAQSKKK